MFKSRSILALTTALILGLTACTAQPVDRMALRHDAHFWQRSDTSSAIHVRGPKAQQMLNRDISRCVTEIRELYRLGAIRQVTPAEIDEYGLVPDPDTAKGALDDWETPYREGYLRAEHLDYHDFETCMMGKGWERLEHTPYDIAEEGREDYIDAIIGEEYNTRNLHRGRFMEKPPSDFEYPNR